MPVRRPLASRVDHRVVVIAIVGAACLALAASGCGDSGAPPPSALTRAAKADASYGVRYRYRSRSSEAGKKVHRLRGYAQTEADQRRSRIVVVGGGIRGEIVRDGHDEYSGGDLAVPGLLGSSSSSKIRWTKLDGARLLKAGYGDKVCRAELPGKVAGALARTGPRLERLGPARAGGRPTTRYRVTTSYGKVLDTLAGNDDAAGCDARDRAATFVADLWIDRDDLVRRVRVRYSLAGVVSVETRDITGYDREVRVAVPNGPAVGDTTGKLLWLADGMKSECTTPDDC